MSILEKQLEKYLRQNEILKDRNKKMHKIFYETFLQMIKFLKNIYPNVPEFQLSKNITNNKSSISSFMQNYNSYVNLLSNFQGYYTHQITNYKQDVQKNINSTLEKSCYFRTSEVIPCKTINLEENLSENLIKIIENLSKENKKLQETIQNVRKQNIEISTKIEEYHCTVNEYSLIIQKLQISLEQKSHLVDSLKQKNDLERISREKIQESEVKWKSRYDLMKNQLNELKNEEILKINHAYERYEKKY